MIEIEICVGSSCHLKGAYNVINQFEYIVERDGLKDKVVIKASFCLGNCIRPVSVRMDDGSIYSVSENEAEVFFDKVVKGRLVNEFNKPF